LVLSSLSGAVCVTHAWQIYYDLVGARQRAGRTDIAIVRVEEIAPFPHHALQQELSRYYSATEFVWVQEEHENQGAASFVLPRLQPIVCANICSVSRFDLMMWW
jgi:2-oxoglutarate dehydrogenase complex dehydrogenase (E1) component-like enzyme